MFLCLKLKYLYSYTNFILFVSFLNSKILKQLSNKKYYHSYIIFSSKIFALMKIYIVFLRFNSSNCFKYLNKKHLNRRKKDVV